MLIEVVGTAHAPRVLVALATLGGTARFTRLREAAGIGDQQMSRVLKFLNGAGLVTVRVLAEEQRRPTEYTLTRLGAEAVEILHAWHQVVHARPGPAAKATDRELEAIVRA
jgi:DNA-binding HxlR family transcriptional regulator